MGYHRSSVSSPAGQLLLTALLIVAPCTILASDGSQQLVAQGMQALERGDNRHALNAFEFATRADPNDGEAYFFYGVAHNRLGAPDEALVALNQSESLGYSNANMDLERGYALTNLGRDAAALETLERYGAAHPASGIAQHLLARLYLRRGELDRSRELANAAKTLDPSLANTAGLIIAYADRDAGDADALGRYVEDLISREPNLPFAERLRRQLAAGAAPPSADAKPWALTLTAGVGYNDNVIAIGDGVPLPSDISNEESVVGSFGAHATYDLLRSTSDFLRAGYALSATLYESDLNDSDLLMNDFYVTWQHRFSSRWTGSVGVSDQYTLLGADKFRNRISMRPAMSYRYSRDWRLEAYVRAATENYYFDTAAINDRDGENIHFGLTTVRRVTADDFGIRLGWQIGGYATDGSNYDRNRTLFYGALAWQLPAGFDAQINGSYSVTGYDNLNSLTGFTAKRDDQAWTLGILASKAIPSDWLGPGMELFGSFDYVDNASNIRFFDYNQLAVNLGISVKF